MGGKAEPWIEPLATLFAGIRCNPLLPQSRCLVLFTWRPFLYSEAELAHCPKRGNRVTLLS